MIHHVTDAEALAEIRGLALAGRVRPTPHALARMRERQVGYGQLRQALSVAMSCSWQAARENWKVEAADLDGDELTIVVVLEDGVVVVTLF
jgi:hypothetical protein